MGFQLPWKSHYLSSLLFTLAKVIESWSHEYLRWVWWRISQCPVELGILELAMENWRGISKSICPFKSKELHSPLVQEQWSSLQSQLHKLVYLLKKSLEKRLEMPQQIEFSRMGLTEKDNTRRISKVGKYSWVAMSHGLDEWLVDWLVCPCSHIPIQSCTGSE